MQLTAGAEADAEPVDVAGRAAGDDPVAVGGAELGQGGAEADAGGGSGLAPRSGGGSGGGAGPLELGSTAVRWMASTW